jgi:hexokinase
MLVRSNTHPDSADFKEAAKAFISEMRRGLEGKPSSLKMLPTYLSSDGRIPDGDVAVAVDIGGTNLRVALIQVENGLPSVLEAGVWPVPGLEREMTKDEFFSAIADKLLPVISKSRRVGVCFSHAAEILPSRDGRLVSFSKEIKVRNAEGMEICRELAASLRKAGVPDITDKRFVLLNDTAAALFGGGAGAGIGLVLGTGMNIGYVTPTWRIKKLRGGAAGETMVVNTEAGCFDKLPFGTFDRLLDAGTKNPGDHLLEKMTGGAYLGSLIGLVMQKAGEDGMLSGRCADAFRLPGAVALPEVSRFLADGTGPMAERCATDRDRAVLHTVIDRLVERAAKLTAAAVSAVMEEAGMEIGPDKPAVIAAEGTTFHKLCSFRERFERYLRQTGKQYRLVSADNATLLGAGLAVLYNS